MKTGIRNVLKVAVASLALGVSGLSLAADQGIAGRIAGKTREAAQQANEKREAQRAEPRPSQPRPAPAPAQPKPVQSQPKPAPSQPRLAPAQPKPEQARPQQPRGEQRPAPRNEPRASNPNQNRSGTAQRNDRNRDPSNAGPRNDRPQRGDSNAQPSRPAPPTSAGTSRNNNNRGITGSVIQREYNTRDPRPDRPARPGNGNRHDHRFDRPRHRTVHVIHHLPPGYRDYAWNGRNYYYYDGFWYRPYGGTYVSVSVPYGFFVTSLPGSYTSVWVGNTRYYYSDYHYYTYEPERRGYVVVPSPYGDDEEEAYDDDLYVYPAQDQSEQQQADDRYECHRWAVAETDYDPIDDEYDADLRQDYLRALTACLVGRGYTVR